MPNFVKIDQLVQKLEDTHTHSHRSSMASS